MKIGSRYLGALLVCMLFFGNKPIPEGRFAVSKDFRPDTLIFSEDGSTYRFVSYRGKPFKKPPFDGWEYYNPAETLRSGKEMLHYAQAESLLDSHSTDQWVFIRPFYQTAETVSGAAYNAFVTYVRDSVIRTHLGKEFNMNYINTYGDQQINWAEPIENAHKDAIADLYYNAESMFSHQMDPRHFTYQMHFPFRHFQVPYPKIMTYINPATDSAKTIKRARFIRKWDPCRVYPDTFLWANDSCLAIDSAAALALANGQWHFAKSAIDAPALVTKKQGRAYVNWVAAKWMRDFGKSMGLSIGEHYLAQPSVYQFTASQQELAHCRITNRDYQEFLLYCKDSFIRTTLGDSYGLMINTNRGTSRIHWEESLRKLKTTEVQEALGNYCQTIEKKPYLEPHILSFKYNSIGQKEAEQAYQRASSPQAFLAKRKIGHFTHRHEISVYPLSDAYQELLSLDQLKPLKSLKNHDAVEGISYEQAQAYWHWRLYEKLKKSPKSTTDFYMPTRSEWQGIQQGKPIQAKQVLLPTRFRPFNYRIYIITS